jgi:azurin
LRVKPGEPIALEFVNPDVVPHNWVLVKPGALAAVGTLADALIADPEAVARHYVPKTDDVLVYADIADPGKRQTIFFAAPATPGRYPFLCTFPGHWKLMHGELIVGE